jgi:hypothetical protein
MNFRTRFLRKITALMLFGFMFFITSNAQDDEGECSLSFTIPEIALIDIEPSGLSNVYLTLEAGSETGQPVTVKGSIHDELWINYTSCLTSGGSSRSVSVQVASGTIPDGVQLILSPSGFSGSGKGTHGIPVGEVILSQTPQTLISGIGRCFTGDGQKNGHKLSYSLRISDYQSLNIEESSNIQIAFTLTDN